MMRLRPRDLLEGSRGFGGAASTAREPPPFRLARSGRSAIFPDNRDQSLTFWCDAAKNSAGMSPVHSRMGGL